ncbi:MAG: LCP family protein [Chloroflexi bacterium]|nr:LCP family protein [Chloroflexota bacterium]
MRDDFPQHVRTNGDSTRSEAPSTPANQPWPAYHHTTGAPPPPPLHSAARERMRRRRVKGRAKGDEWAWVVIALALLAVVLIVSGSLFVFMRALQNQPEPIALARAAQLPTPVDMRTNVNNSSVNSGAQLLLDDGRSIVLEPWDGQSRFTLLLMGIDRRPDETGLQYRTDTMLLVSIAPLTATVGVLSIPRDLFVEVPGYGQLQRVNTPMVLGELQQPGYGPTLAMQTVQYNFGIRVHDYFVVDFDAFITLVDVIGGIDVSIDYTIDDPTYPDLYYGYDPLYMPPGDYHLNGYEALRFARTRHGSSDFERALRQQQVINAIRERILDLDMLPSLIVQAPSMYANLSDNLFTGLTLDQMIQLAWYLKDIPAENIQMGVVDQRYTFNYTTAEGAQVLVPDRALLGPLMVEIFGDNYSE